MSGNTVTTDAETAGPSVLTAIDEYMHAYVVPTFTKGWQHYLDNGTFSLHDIANPQTLAEDMRAKYEELGKYADYVFKDDAGYKRAMVGYTEEQRQDAMRTMVEEADRDARASVIFDAALPLADKAGFDEKIPELVRSLRPSQRLQASLALRGAREFASALNAYRDDGKERDDREAAYVSLLESVGGHGKKDVAATVKTTLAVRDLLRKTDLTTTRLMTRDSQRVALEKNQMPEKPHRTMEQRQVIRSLTKAVQSRWGDAVAKGSPNADQLEVALVYLGAKKQAPEPDTASKRSEYVPNEFGPTAVHLPGSTQSRSTADRLRRGAKWGALGAMAGYAGNLLNSAAAVAEPVTPAIGQHSIESRAASQPLSLDDIRQRVAPPGQTQAMDTVPLANAAAPLQQSDAQPQQGVPAAASQETNIAVPAFKAPEQTAAAVNTTPGQEFVGVPLGPLNEPTLPQAAANTPAAASFVNTNTGHVTDGHPKPAESSSSTGHDTHTGQPSASEQVVVAAPAAAAPAAGMVAVQNIMAEQSLAKSDFEQALENNSISFQDLLDKYENTVLEASTTHFDLTDNPGYLQNTMTQASHFSC